MFCNYSNPSYYGMYGESESSHRLITFTPAQPLKLWAYHYPLPATTSFVLYHPRNPIIVDYGEKVDERGTAHGTAAQVSVAFRPDQPLSAIMARTSKG